MKVIRIAQAALKRSSPRSFTVILDSKLQIEAKSPKITSHPLDQKRKLKGLAAWLLPEGYPRGVHHNYLNYSLWNTIQGISTSFIGVISTQAMLGTLMKLSGNDPGWLSQGAAAATINWILKDGLGQAGGIAVMAFLGGRLDSQARIMRFRSTVFFLLGSIIELSIPLVYSSFSDSFSDSGWMFVALASAANVLKNVSWMLVSATRAHFMKNFALKDNLGDLTGKAASQMTLASLIGTGLGLLALKSETFLANPSVFVGLAWTVNAVVCVAATVKLCKAGLSRQLDPQRIFNLIEIVAKHRGLQTGHLCRYIWTPELIAEREPPLWAPKLRNNLKINASINIISEKMNWIVSLDKLEDKKFSVARKIDDGHYYIWTLKGANSTDLIEAIATAALDAFPLQDVSPIDILEALKLKGWDLEAFHFDKEEDCLQIETNKDE